MQNCSVIIVPGYDNSGPGHWQTLWEQENSNFIRVQQRDWIKPVGNEWVAALDATIRSTSGPKILVGHSLGCSTIAQWAITHHDTVVGALLVAPPDLETPAVKAVVPQFPNAISRLAFPSIVVASTNDDYCSLEKATNLAKCWGSQLVALESARHINVDSGYGEWPYGKQLLQDLICKR